jgi:hypothetical protein
MDVRQEFLVLESNGDVAVYAPSDFPVGTPIGRDAKRLRVAGPSRVRPPGLHLSRRDFEQWRQELEREGRSVSLDQFWSNPQAVFDSEDFLAHGNFRPLEDVRDELLRQADGRVSPEA